MSSAPQARLTRIVFAWGQGGEMLIWIGVTLLLSMAYPTLFALIVCYGIFDGESPRTQFIFYGLISIGTPYFFRQMAPGLLRALVPK